MKIRLWLTASALVLAALAATPAGADPLQFGDRTMEIPAPAGFVPTSVEAPFYVEYLQKTMPATNRLVEAYLSPETMAALLAGTGGAAGRRFQLQVPREMDGKPMSASLFGQIVDNVASELDTLLKSTEVEEHLDRIGNLEGQPRIGVDSLVNHGVTRREPWGIFYTTSLLAQSEDNGKPVVRRVYTGNVLMLVDGQALFLYASSNDQFPDAKQFVEQSTAAWADAIRAANASGPTSAVPADPSGSDGSTGSVASR